MRTATFLKITSTLLLLVLIGCNFQSDPIDSQVTNSPADPTPTFSPTPSPVPPRLLTICMGQEPASLFIYGDGSPAARGVRQAIYDGPFDVIGYDLVPVILQKMPNPSDGDVVLEPVSVQPGSLIVDINGELLELGEGVLYYPPGCRDASCAQTYTGQDPIQLEQLVVQFRLRPGILWSDGEPLTADDSLYSFEVANELYPRARANLVVYTESYRALEDTSVEWRGVPGYRTSSFASHFFDPLPRHILGGVTGDELLTADISSRMPIGWGPYVVDEWTPGDHITLSKNPNYFRKDEGFPAFDRLVFRFIPDKDEAIAALLAGECDFLDETIGLETHSAQLMELSEAGNVSAVFTSGAAWEHMDFGIDPLGTSSQPSLFRARETRQAIAMCIDRQRLADELFQGLSQVPDSFVSSTHPLYNPDVKRYTYDPIAASAALDNTGWLDSDGDPNTPRVSVGVQDVPDGTPFVVTLSTSNESEKLHSAQVIRESLAQCGVQVEISAMPWEELFAPGPAGPIFGRNFSLAQYAWGSSMEPPCYLYTTKEIPGPYPNFPKGWGGANASGYSNPLFDQACQNALTSFPSMPEYLNSHLQAQAIFVEDIPSIPLYSRLKAVAMRPDMCEVVVDPSASSSLWNLELLDYGEGCVN